MIRMPTQSFLKCENDVFTTFTSRGILGRRLVLGGPIIGSWYGQSEKVQSLERFCYALTEAPYVTFCHYNSPPHVFLFHSALHHDVTPVSLDPNSGVSAINTKHATQCNSVTEPSMTLLFNISKALFLTINVTETRNSTQLMQHVRVSAKIVFFWLSWKLCWPPLKRTQKSEVLQLYQILCERLRLLEMAKN